ncbi:OmpA/MotB family protein [Eoetvoesiella caeni]|uniref:Chemotaxis protein MotB n=1 Tax=Eoetvoesiella caeni TaxID=645616 RepID=A0A366H1H3_9BURK|nr:OmpA family protein [Eoetvoesiella caeni]MCI2810862.1 OmpA family protein [Eoetvoesiella caeni]RBP35733.1 chemotaxis protein MotB [Eoetvoesiella caeni]
MSVLHQNKWYVEPVPDEETEGWLLNYLDLITLLLVLLVVMLALSGQATKQPPALATSSQLPAHDGSLPGEPAPDVLQAIPAPETPVHATPAIDSLTPASFEDDSLPAVVANTELGPPTSAPSLADPDVQQATPFVDPPSYFLAATDSDAVLSQVIEVAGSAPAPIASTPAAPEPATEGMDLLALPELGDDIEIIRKKESISFRINSEILYSSAKADLSLEGLAVLQKLLPVLKSTEYSITVEGHTDALPIRRGQYPSNWELSGARAGRVVRYLVANGVQSTRLSAIGYADTRALASNNTEQGRASNRRVEIVLEQPAKPAAH